MSASSSSPRRALLGGLLALAGVIVLAAVAAWIVGPNVPVGRNSRSATPVGHKAFASLLESLEFEVTRFDRGLESLPARRGVLLAIEPGPALFRARGRFARPLLEWVADGNAALVTLGRDPDHAAEADDRAQLFGDTARRALELARRAEARAREGEGEAAVDGAPGANAPEDREGANSSDDRTSPEGALASTSAALDPSESWDAEVLLRLLDLSWIDSRAAEHSRSSTVALEGALVAELGSAPRLALTRPRTFRWIDRASTSTATALLALDGEPLVLEVAWGRGRILLLSEPRLLQNGAIARADHARLGVRLIERLSRSAEGSRFVAFEEWSHGAREVGNIFELATTSRAKWGLLQTVLAALVWIWASAQRRRSVVPFEVPPRRSRHEVIDAMASLFLRSGDVAGAERRLLQLTRLRLARALGIPGAVGGDQALVAALAERTARPRDEVQACLTGPPVRSQRALMEKAETLRTLRASLDVRR